MVLKYLDLSTGHIKKENHDHLLLGSGSLFDHENGFISITAYPYECGTFLSLGEIEPEDIDYLNHQGYEDLAQILEYCDKNQIDLIRFDTDAELMEELPSYEW